MPKRRVAAAATFGQRPVALRKAVALTQQELADEVGVSLRRRNSNPVASG